MYLQVLWRVESDFGMYLQVLWRVESDFDDVEKEFGKIAKDLADAINANAQTTTPQIRDELIFPHREKRALLKGRQSTYRYNWSAK